MKNIKKIAIDIFGLSSEKSSRSGGAHEISIESVIDRSGFADSTKVDFANIAKHIDHTLLKVNTTKDEIRKIIKEANEFKFKSICINSSYIPFAKSLLAEDVLICTVVGFPLGACNSDAKYAETKVAISQGANEIDMVINIGLLLSGEYDLVFEEIKTLAEICHKSGAILKVIIETALLDYKNKVIACLLSKKAGADFVKTSTGFSTGGATIQDITLMREVVGTKMGVKASGGIRNRQTALQMLKAGANRVGASSSIDIVCGVSSSSNSNGY